MDGQDVYENGMRLALEQAGRAQAAGEPPFGVVILDAGGALIAAEYDRVRSSGDMSAHAEVLAVRAACAVYGPDLSGCVLYTTCEPCPMCYTAAWLARIGTIVYGTTMADVHALMGAAQRELQIPAATVNVLNAEPLTLIGGVAAERCLGLFQPAS